MLDFAMFLLLDIASLTLEHIKQEQTQVLLSDPQV